jgi:thioredoxin 1
MVLVDFWAGWCAPCRGFAPIYEKVSEKYPSVVFGKVNTEEQRKLSVQFGILSIPTLMIFRKEIVIFSQAGRFPESHLDEIVDKAQKLDMNLVRQEVENKRKNSQN